MANRSLTISDPLRDYILTQTMREPELLAELRAETAALPEAIMQISPEQGRFMALLVELIGARRAIEIGTFTGYSSICVAQALAADGRLICCDVSEAYTAVAKRYWQRAGLSDRIELHLAPATRTLDGLLASGGAGSFDFAFIDADKSNYDTYFERVLALLRPGGLVAVDNVLWGGDVADPANNSPETVAIRALNAKLRDDARVSTSLVPIGDGLTLARKRG